MYRVQWAWWIPGVFAATWMCVEVSANAARHQDDVLEFSSGSTFTRGSDDSGHALTVEWTRPSASNRLIALHDGRVIAGNAVFEVLGGSYLGYAAPDVIEVLASGMALSIDPDGHLARRPIDLSDETAEIVFTAGSPTNVLVARPSRDGSMVYVVERADGGSLKFSIRKARSLSEVASTLLVGFDLMAPLFVLERNGGVVVAGRRARVIGEATGRSRWAQVQLGGGDARVVETHDLEGTVEALAVDDKGALRLALRRGAQLDVVEAAGGETLLSMSSGNVRSVVFAPKGEQLAVTRARADARTEVSLLSMAPSGGRGGLLWRGVVEHEAPSIAFSASAEKLFVNGHSLLCVGDERERRVEFVEAKPTLFGSWYAVPHSSAPDLRNQRRYETFDGRAVLEESRWGREILQKIEPDDLGEWGGLVLSVATGIGPLQVTEESFETEIWSDRSGIRHASMTVPRSLSTSGQREYVIAQDGAGGVSVRRLEVDDALDASVVATYRARLMNYGAVY